MFFASDLFIIGGYLIGTLILLVAAGRWILAPFTEALLVLKTPRRFMLSDFAWLLIGFQAALALIVHYIPRKETGLFLSYLFFGFIAVTGIWVGAVSACSQAGIIQPLRRGLFILLHLPLVVLFMIGTGLAAGGSYAFWFMRTPYRDDATWLHIGAHVIILAAWLLICWILRAGTGWLVGRLPPEMKQSGA